MGIFAGINAERILFSDDCVDCHEIKDKTVHCIFRRISIADAVWLGNRVCDLTCQIRNYAGAENNGPRKSRLLTPFREQYLKKLKTSDN